MKTIKIRKVNKAIFNRCVATEIEVPPLQDAITISATKE